VLFLWVSTGPGFRRCVFVWDLMQLVMFLLGSSWSWLGTSCSIRDAIKFFYGGR
jgi:hypothetical protein